MTFLLTNSSILFFVCIEVQNTMFWGQVRSPYSGTLLPKQLSFYGD